MMTMPSNLVDKLKNQFGDAILETREEPNEILVVTVETSKVEEIATYIKHELGFTYPNTVIGTDFLDEGVISVSWLIGNTETPWMIALTVNLPRDNTICPSLTYIWEGLNWDEREVYDMFGVKFDGHPDLRRILLPDDWDGYPLREDYVYKRPMYSRPEEGHLDEEYKSRFRF